MNIIEDDNNNVNEVDMIGEGESPHVLLAEYENNALTGFGLGIQYLNLKYKKLVRVRGDGNCFYRALFFSYLENLLNKYIDGETEIADNERKRFLKIIVDSKDELIQFEYSEIAIESFYDMVVEMLSNLFQYKATEILNNFQASGLSDYYTWYMRLLTSLNMKKNVEKFLPFIDDVDVPSYCLKEVEPMGKEVEEPMIVALTEYLGINVLIEYLDGRFNNNELASVRFGNTVAEDIHVYLLYRPGHYDILYM